MKRISILILVALFLAVPASPQAQQNTPFTFKSTTEVVLVNVTAKDKDGNFIRDLKAEDFSILEDGKAQKVLSMDVENTDALAVNEIQVPNLLGALNSVSASTAASSAAAPADVAAAVVPKELFRDRRLIVLFFDLSSMQPEEVKRASESAENYIDKQMKPADVVAVVSLHNTLQVDQDFTSNRDVLKSIVHSFNPDAATGFEDGSTGASSTEDGVTDDTFTADDTEYNVFNTDRRLDALKNIAETLTGIEQKKSLIYFSSGMSQTGLENQSQLRAATNAAVRANMSIYTIDVRGLQALAPGGGAAGGRGGGGGGGGRGGGGGGRGGGSAMFSGRSMQQSFDSNFASQETLVTLAGDTGGKAFLDTNDFRPAFSKVQEDTAMYYVLGYTSTSTLKDGKFRRITVSVKRKDVAKVDFRRGYYSEADFQHTTKENRETQLQEQLASDLPSTDLPVYLSTGYFKLADLRYFVPVSIVVPGSAIPFTRDSDQDKATIDILGVARDQRARIPFGNIRDTVKLAVNTTQEVKRKNVQYNAGFLLPPGNYNVKFVLRENQTGQIGSFEADIFVPNLKDAPVKISSVIASSQKQAAKAKKDNPLFRNGSEIIPSVTHVFTADQHLYLFYEIYDPAKPEHILTNATFFKGSTKAFETPLVEANQINTPDRKAAAIELDVPLTSLKPGFYTCQINVIDDAAGKFVFPRLALLIR